MWWLFIWLEQHRLGSDPSSSSVCVNLTRRVRGRGRWPSSFGTLVRRSETRGRDLSRSVRRSRGRVVQRGRQSVRRALGRRRGSRGPRSAATRTGPRCWESTAHRRRRPCGRGRGWRGLGVNDGDAAEPDGEVVDVRSGIAGDAAVVQQANAAASEAPRTRPTARRTANCRASPPCLLR